MLCRPHIIKNGGYQLPFELAMLIVSRQADDEKERPKKKGETGEIMITSQRDPIAPYQARGGFQRRHCNSAVGLLHRLISSRRLVVGVCAHVVALMVLKMVAIGRGSCA
jgi:hypothetical protein